MNYKYLVESADEFKELETKVDLLRKHVLLNNGSDATTIVVKKSPVGVDLSPEQKHQKITKITLYAQNAESAITIESVIYDEKYLQLSINEDTFIINYETRK